MPNVNELLILKVTDNHSDKIIFTGIMKVTVILHVVITLIFVSDYTIIPNEVTSFWKIIPQKTPFTT